MKARDAYGDPKVFAHPNITVRVYSPILSDEERATRIKQIYRAAEELLKSKR